MRIVFLTRFSFFGKSGWRSNTSTQEQKLFDTGRLEKRFELFEKITVPSLCSQTDLQFDWIILSSDLMPDAYKNRLRKIARSMPIDGDVTCLFRSPGSAADEFGYSIQRRYPKQQLLSSVVLDDDDGLSDDFVVKCRAGASHAWCSRDINSDYVITTFPNGYSLLLSREKCEIYVRHVPFTNLGLTLTSRVGHKASLFNMSHKMIGKRHPNHVVEDSSPVYLRAIHDENDSRAMIHIGAQQVGFSEVQARFSGLKLGEM